MNLESAVSLVFPHQLFEYHPALQKNRKVILLEETLFFKQYRFHKQKILFMRASMKFYEDHLKKENYDVVYIESADDLSDVRNLIPFLKKRGVYHIYYADPVDDWLENRLKETASENDIRATIADSPMFFNTAAENKTYYKHKKKFRQTDYYIHQRKQHAYLITNDNKPLGGKWTYDFENRKRYPKDKKPPETVFSSFSDWHREAVSYTQTHFSQNPGGLSGTHFYPVTFDHAKKWAEQFFQERFHQFGTYQDAILRDELVLNHSLLSPMLNNGLLTPEYVVERALSYGFENEVSLNSQEGFLRQIVGWREFMRAVYQLQGRYQRTRNFWGFDRKIPISFWKGTTGIEPLDDVIKKVSRTGYCHHIERLMVLGNFMLLCEFDPDEVYQWFIEMFVDAWDWVMVPNVYGMSQFADGGMMATKPYISGSNYIMKMSDYRKGDWQDIWDALFWRFIDTHRKYFMDNPRLGLMVKRFDNMPEEKRKTLLARAEIFLDSL